MENFAPGLRESVLGLAEALRVVVYFLCVTGLIIQVQQARADAESILRPIVRAVLIVGLVATLPAWFGFTEKVFLSVANTVQEGYTDHPMRTAGKLRETVSGGSGEFNLRRVGESLYQAFLASSVKVIVLVASLLQVPFLILQFVLKLLCYLFLPVALGLFMIPSQAQLAGRYIQQTLAILAWPVGFAVTELVAYHLLTGYANNLAVAYDLTPGEIDPASFGSLLGGLVAALWLIIGTVGTPFLMQGLIGSGSPVGVGGGAALHHLFTLHQVASMLKTAKTGGIAAAAAAAAPGKGGSASGNGAPPAPPAPPAAPPPAPPPPAPSPASDPTGDTRAAAALGLARLPTPQTSL